MANRDCVGRIERHHIMSGSDRNKSTKYGLIAPLCTKHHRIGNDAVHQSRQTNDKLKALAHIAFEKHYPKLDWLKIFGRNYKHLLTETVRICDVTNCFEKGVSKTYNPYSEFTLCEKHFDLIFNDEDEEDDGI